MSLRVNQNVLSIKTHGTLSQTSTRLEKSIEKLSSGLRINRAADDAAGLAISEKLRRQIRGLSRAVLNAQDGISMIQSAEGALGETHSILQRMRELAIESSNDTLTTNDRLEIQKEINQLRDDIDRIAFNTEFNSKKLLDGSQTALISANSKYAQGLVVGDAVGGDYAVSLALLKAGAAQVSRSQIFTLKETGELADGSTALEDVAQFYDNNGQFILDTPKTLTLNSFGRQTSITVDGGFTLGYLANQIDGAIKSSSGLDQANANIKFLNPIDGMTGGYLQVVSGVIGDRGEINFSGDQGLIQALGIATVREASNSVIKGTAIDIYGNAVTTQTNDSRLFGVIAGIDVAFDSQSAQVAGLKGFESGLSLAAAATFAISIFDASGAQYGATQTISVAAGRWTMNGIQRVLESQISVAVAANSGLLGLEAQISDGQVKLAFNPSNSGITSQFNITAGGGASVIGINSGTYYSSVTGTKDKDSMLEGISQYDAGSTGGIVTLTISDGQNEGAGVTTAAINFIDTVSVVTTADMVTEASLFAAINTALAAVDSDVRVDRVGDSLAFTSKTVGKRSISDTEYDKAKVSLVFGGAAADITIVQDKLDLDTLVAEGSGDSTIRMHVVSNTPQFQIGADQGQAMKVSMSNMSAKALGVTNLDMTSIEGATKAIGILNSAIDKVSAERSKLGAFQNRLEYAINNLQNTHSNLTSAELRLRDADIAQEMIEFTRNQIVSQSGTAMLAQANLVPQGVLQLLR